MLNYEKGFQNFDELIYTNEQLNSFLHASKEHCLEKLKDQYTVCQTISIINLKKKKHVFEIQNRNVFSTLHPLSKKHLFFQTECFSPKESLKNFEVIFPNGTLMILKLIILIFQKTKIIMP